MSPEEKMIEVESQLAHLARHVENLDEVIIDQGKQIDHLVKYLKRLDSRLGRIESHIETGQKPLGEAPEASPWKDPEM